MRNLSRILCLALVATLALPPAIASGHAERHTKFPSGRGHVPRYRTTGPELVVCRPDTAARLVQLPPEARARNEALLGRCRFHDIQAAVDHVKRRGSRIEVMPGVYREKPTLRAAVPKACEGFYRRARDRDDTNDLMTYRQQLRCPHAINLIAWFGDRTPRDRSIACNSRWCDLQLEGTGAAPQDVVLDARFRKLNVVRADRADGAYFRNFTVQGSTFNGLYVIETHGLIERCEAYGNGDSGVYPGGQADLHGARPSVEIRRCFSHHNELGYSGTAGNSTYVHDNVFAHNGTGIVTDSFYGGHPGLPEDSARFVHNRIHGNNQDYFGNWDRGVCQRPYRKWGYFHWHGERIRNVCPTVPGPVGVGLLIAGGNQNLVARNRIYDNWRYGTFLFWVPATFRGDDDPEKQHDTSHFNKYVMNRMGNAPGGAYLPNGTDFWWDVEGAGNCWQDNRDRKGITSSPPPDALPNCDQEPVFYPGPTVSVFASCATWDGRTNNHPPGCPWMDRPARPHR
jgi:hypothetical protein